MLCNSVCVCVYITCTDIPLYFHLNDQKFNYADGPTDIVILWKLICYVMQYNWNLCLMFTLFCVCQFLSLSPVLRSSLCKTYNLSLITSVHIAANSSCVYRWEYIFRLSAFHIHNFPTLTHNFSSFISFVCLTK